MLHLDIPALYHLLVIECVGLLNSSFYLGEPEILKSDQSEIDSDPVLLESDEEPHGIVTLQDLHNSYTYKNIHI